MKYLFRILCAVALGMLLSCGEYNKLSKSRDYMVKYEAAKEYFAMGSYNRAALFLQETVTVLKGTDRGEECLYLLAMSNYRARNYAAAAQYFRKYYQAYPRGIYTEEAQFYCGKSLYADVPDTRLDQTATFEAVTEFQNYLENYPTGSRAREAQDCIFALQDKLVEKEYLSAKLYFDLGSYFGNCTNGGSNYQACIVTAENAIREYPYTSRREDLAFLILRAKFDLAAQSVDAKKEERYHDAIDEYYGFTNEFPESRFKKEAEALYRKARKYVKSSDTEENVTGLSQR